MPLIKPLKRVDAAYQGFKVVKYWLGISRKSYLFSCCYLFRKTFFIGFNEDLKCFSIPDLRTRFFFFFRNKPWFLFHQTILRNFVFDLFNTYSKWLNEEKNIVLYFDTCWYGKLLHKYQIYFFFVKMQYICTIRWSFIGLRK